MSDGVHMEREELRTWVLEELDQNLRLLTAIEAFRFKSELLPAAHLHRITLHHQYLLRLLHRTENPIHSAETTAMVEAMQDVTVQLERDRLHLLDAMPDSGNVAELYYDPAWNHHNIHVQLSFAPDELLAEQQDMKERIEHRKLSPRVRLRSALQGLPVPWLKVIHQNLGMTNADQYTKPRLIAAIATRLNNPTEAGNIYAGLSAEQRALFATVAENGGVMALSDVHDIFGDDYIDGYFWDVHPPQTTLGSLRALALIFVGELSSTGQRSAVIATELRPLAEGERLPDNVVVFPGKHVGKKRR